MKRASISGAIAAAALLACDHSATEPVESRSPIDAVAAAAATPATATIQFGANAHGSPFAPALGHDRSVNAKDNLIPRTVVIARGGSVTFTIDPVHQAAVYEPGTEPSDIAVGPGTLEDVTLAPGFTLPNFRINDPAGRLALGPAQALTPQTWTTPAGTFDEPGRYLVICTTTPHFVGASMYGWVIVK